MEILRYLLFYPASRFSEINKTKLDTDKFNYHLKTLIKQKLVEKIDNKYFLTLKGKEFSNTMDTDSKIVEKQPKVSVLIVPAIKEKGIIKYIVQKRLKEPYFGYIGFMTGKVRFGETIEETCKRELNEEMNLTADFKYRYLLHEMVYDKKGSILEDKFFNVVEAFNITGELKNIEGGENFYVNKDEFLKLNPVYHNEFDIFKWYLEERSDFIEQKYYISSF